LIKVEEDGLGKHVVEDPAMDDSLQLLLGKVNLRVGVDPDMRVGDEISGKKYHNQKKGEASHSLPL
jgi:hypothetical protein